MTATATPILEEYRDFVSLALPPRVRPLRQFAEEEITLPDGPYQGRRFRCDRQPYTGLLFDAIDSGDWDHVNALGPTQSGKTLACFVIPILWHLFELRDTSILGVPDIAMGGDKWNQDLRPAIERSRYREQIRGVGAGSRGGSKVEAIQFRNGVTLRIMAGGGGDKQRAGFTARVLAVTESDGLDESAKGSREASKIAQLIGRTRAFSNASGRPARIYTECTVSDEQGYTWATHIGATESRLALPCPHCGAFVSPEREHLRGWQAAQTEGEAQEGARFICPECEQAWTELERRDANAAAVLVHKGQTVDRRGTVEGPVPDIRRLSFRWSAVNNLLISAADLARDEWNAAQAANPEDADREMCQFVWAVPPLPLETPVTVLSSKAIRKRLDRLPRGLVASDTRTITVGIDIGKWRIHYVVLAFGPDGVHVPDYGIVSVASEELGILRGTETALNELRDRFAAGYTVAQPDGGSAGTLTPEQVWIDVGWVASAPAIFAFCRGSAEVENLAQTQARYRAAKGYGLGQERRIYTAPRKTGNVAVHLGEGYHFMRNRKARVIQVEVDANYWKTVVHERLILPTSNPLAVSLFQAPANEHVMFSKHMTAERQVERYQPGRGNVRVWEVVSRENHYFDAICLAMAAGHFAGERDAVEQTGARPAESARAVRAARRGAMMQTADGRPWFILDR